MDRPSPFGVLDHVRNRGIEFYRPAPSGGRLHDLAYQVVNGELIVRVTNDTSFEVYEYRWKLVRVDDSVST